MILLKIDELYFAVNKHFSIVTSDGSRGGFMHGFKSIFVTRLISCTKNSMRACS